MEKEPRSSDITEEGSLHPYRTEIPNTVVRGTKSRGLSIYAKWLYVYLKSRAGDGGKSTCSTTTIATEAGMSRGQVSAAKKELAAAGLIAVSPGKNPRRHSDQIRIKNIWLLNMQEFSVHNTNTSEDEQGTHFQVDSNKTVHNTNTEKPASELSVQGMNSLNKSGSLEIGEDEANSVHDTNTNDSSVFTTRTQCSQYEQGVHSMNQRRSQEEDPKKKISEGEREHAHARTPDVSHITGFEEHAFAASAGYCCPPAFVPDNKIREWAQENYPDVDVDTELEAMRDWESPRPVRDWNLKLKSFIRQARTFRSRPGRKNRNPQGMTDKEYSSVQNGIELAKEILDGSGRSSSLPRLTE